MLGCGLCTETGAVQIYLHNVMIVLNWAIHHWALAPGNSCVCDKNIQVPVEFLNLLVDGLFHNSSISHINLVRLPVVADQLLIMCGRGCKHKESTHILRHVSVKSLQHAGMYFCLC